jgi:hypothetical protein
MYDNKQDSLDSCNVANLGDAQVYNHIKICPIIHLICIGMLIFFILLGKKWQVNLAPSIEKTITVIKK